MRRNLLWLSVLAGLTMPSMQAFDLSLHAQADSLQEDAHPTDTSRFLPWSLTMWGQHRSNTIDHQLGQLLVRGGNIDRTLVDAARAAQGGDMGGFGFSTLRGSCEIGRAHV